MRWRVQTGQLAHPCPMLAGYGVSGTPVADPVSRTLYLVDAFGRMHALDLATGAERPGWPVTLYTDYRDEIEWGALALADGYVYAGTGTYCDQPAATPLYRVSTTTREVTSWTPVPRNLGGGGGIWGWGGVAYSAARDSLYVVTGNAIQENETAGYGERLVELSPSLQVRASSHPADVVRHDDLDFVGSPVVADVPGCGELVAAVNKNGTLYGWRADAVASGPSWFVRLQPADPAKPLLTQPAWSSALRSYFVVTYSQLVRVQVGSDCRPSVAWRLDLKNPTLNGSPTVAGGTVWLELSADSRDAARRRRGDREGARAAEGRRDRLPRADRDRRAAVLGRDARLPGRARARGSGGRAGDARSRSTAASPARSAGRAASPASTRPRTAAGPGGACSRATPLGSSAPRRAPG